MGPGPAQGVPEGCGGWGRFKAIPYDPVPGKPKGDQGTPLTCDATPQAELDADDKPAGLHVRRTHGVLKTGQVL